MPSHTILLIKKIYHGMREDLIKIELDGLKQ